MGGKKIMGYTAKDVNAKRYKGRFKVRCKDTTLRLPVEEMLDWKINVIDTDSIYIAPKLCQDSPE